MADRNETDSDLACALVWKLARRHGWSAEVPIPDLVADAAVMDENRGRDIARNILPDKSFVGYHQGRDAIWLDPPPTDEVAEFLIENCGYGALQVEATLDSYL